MREGRDGRGRPKKVRVGEMGQGAIKRDGWNLCLLPYVKVIIISYLIPRAHYRAT